METALLDHGLLRSSAPRGESAPEQATIDPERSEPSSNGTDDTPTETSTSSSEVDASIDVGTATTEEGDSSAPKAESSGDSPASAQSRSAESGNQDQQPRSPSGVDAEQAFTAEGFETTTNLRDSENESRESAQFTAPVEQATLDGETTAGVLKPALENLPSLRVLGQFRETYIVAESPDGLVLIDQHAADERINYERLQERFADDTPAQALASPIELDLTAGEAALFEVEECAAAFDQLGFEVSRVDETSVEITSVPGIVKGMAAPELLRDALTAFAAGDRAGETVEAAVDELLADLACYPSLTGNTSLTEATVVDLLAALDACENPYACPHGRPVIIELPDADIDARFERDYPGHPRLPEQ